MKLKEIKSLNPVLQSSVLKWNKKKVVRGVLYPVIEGDLDYSAYVMLSGDPSSYFDNSEKEYYRALFHFGAPGFTPVINGTESDYTLKGVFVVLVPEYGNLETPLPDEAENNFFLSSTFKEIKDQEASKDQDAAHWGKKDCSWKLKYADDIDGSPVEGKNNKGAFYLAHSTETNTTFYCPKEGWRNHRESTGNPSEHDAFGIDNIDSASGGLGAFAEVTEWHVVNKKKWRFEPKIFAS